MINIFERIQKGEGIFFNKIIDKRFKVNRYAVNFHTDFDELSRSDYAAAAYILSDCCAEYPSHALTAKRLSELYDASISSDTAFGTCRNRVTAFTASAIDNNYVLGKENLEIEICNLIRSCILNPLTQNGIFDGNVTSLMRTELIDTIDSVINDKNVYAAFKANQTAYVGEPMENTINGTRSEAELVTPASAFAAYQKMLKTSRIEIFAAGSSDFAAAEDILGSMFANTERGNIASFKPVPSALKQQPVHVSDTFPMQQGILRMIFKAPALEDREAMTLLSLILGVMTTSRFFQNIREKQSLCYYCSCNISKNMRTLTAYAGVEPQNLKRTEEAVIAELENIQKNGVTAEEIEMARLDIKNQTRSIYDSAASLINWYANQSVFDEYISPEEQCEALLKVDAERIQEAARQYKLDTVYSLSGLSEEVSE